VSTYLVLDEIDPGKARRDLLPIEERLKTLHLDLRMDEMSEEDRALTAAALRQAADRLGKD
jgi:hypothetical protein